MQEWLIPALSLVAVVAFITGCWLLVQEDK